jgi:hypothetical protein
MSKTSLGREKIVEAVMKDVGFLPSSSCQMDVSLDGELIRLFCVIFQGYIKVMIESLSQAEDLESVEDLHILHSLMQTIRSFLIPFEKAVRFLLTVVSVDLSLLQRCNRPGVPHAGRVLPRSRRNARMYVLLTRQTVSIVASGR